MDCVFSPLLRAVFISFGGGGWTLNNKHGIQIISREERGEERIECWNGMKQKNASQRPSERRSLLRLFGSREEAIRNNERGFKFNHFNRVNHT